MKTSPLFRLNWQDLLKGLVVAILTPVLVILQELVANNGLTLEWFKTPANIQFIGMAAVGGFVGYLIKNLLTPQQEVTQLQDGLIKKADK